MKTRRAMEEVPMIKFGGGAFWGSAKMTMQKYGNRVTSAVMKVSKSYNA